MTITAELFHQRFASLLGKLDLPETQVLLDHLERVAAVPNETLVRCGRHADSLYLIWEGRLALSLEIAAQELAVGEIGPGQFVGVAAVIHPGPALLTVKVTEPGTLLRLTHEGLVQLRAAQPRLGSDLLRAFSLNLVNWLRTYEDYIAECNQPDDVVEFFRLGRLIKAPS